MTLLPSESSPAGTPRDPSNDPAGDLGALVAPLAEARDVHELEARLAAAALGGLRFRAVHVLRAREGAPGFARRGWSREDGAGAGGPGGTRPLRDLDGALEAVAMQAWKSGAAIAAMAEGPRRMARAMGAVPIGRPEARLGVVAGEWEAAATPPNVEDALAGFALAATRAYDSYRRGDEARRRAEQAAAIEELARAAVTPRNLAEILHLAVRLAARGGGADGGAIWSLAEGGGLRLEAAHGAPATRERNAAGVRAVAAEVVERLRPQVVTSPQDDLRVPPDAAAALAGFSVWPLISYGRARGVLAVYVDSRSAAGFRCEAAERQFLSTLADQVALAADHAARFAELGVAERREREARAELRRCERRAETGDLAARAAREVAAAVATIRAFAGRAVRATEPEAVRDCLDVVQRETARIERVLGELEAHAALEPPALRLGSLNDVVQAGLAEVGEILVRRRVRMVKKLAPDLPPLLLDTGRIGQAIDHLVKSTLEAVGIGGRVRIETRRAANHVVLEVAHDGARAAGGVLEQLFVPFAAARPGGPSLGLAVAQRIVQEHGGEIRVRAEGEWSTVLSFTLPVAGNQDRRQSPVDRRRAGRERRAGPAA